MIFQVTIDRDEDGIWIAECPSIPGCISQGKTKAEAVRNVRDAIRLCLEVRAERGLPLTVETCQVEVRPGGQATFRRQPQGGKAFRTFGWQVVRRESSHIIMVREGGLVTLSIPNHDPVAKGTLRGVIRSAGLTVEEFVGAL
jgi:predicted RNase H-like HicB family nuclease/predicted RNA binding protein YcfA (HicA-like mRNA interferase family)